VSLDKLDMQFVPNIGPISIAFSCPNSISVTSMQKRSALDTSQLMRRAEDLINAASNRYRITVQVANRAQRRRFEEFDSLDDPKMKPVIRAIIEMSDELTQPEIIGE
jgi:DNA-directed RNA polymerase subunit omega